jgi:hypothetical protein
LSPRSVSLGSLSLLDRSRRGRVPLAFQQFELLASGLTRDALRGQVPGAFIVGSFELVESPSNCPAVDAELMGNVCLALTAVNAPAYPLNVPIGKFGCGSHQKIYFGGTYRGTEQGGVESGGRWTQSLLTSQRSQQLSQIGGAFRRTLIPRSRHPLRLVARVDLWTPW